MRWRTANNRRRRPAWFMRPRYLGTDEHGNHLFIVHPRVYRDLKRAKK